MTGGNTAIDIPRHDDADMADDVRAELARILEHEQFKDTTRLKRFLTYVVEEALAGRADRLKGYSVGLEVFDRPENFDPQADTIVRVQAGQLRRRLDLYYSDAGRDSTLRILLPKGRYAPIFERRTRALPAPQDFSHTLPQGLEGRDGAGFRDPLADDEAARPRILVPRFKDLSDTSAIPFFAEGLKAETINALVQFRYLHIIAGSLPEDDQSAESLRYIRETLGADFVLLGNVRYNQDLVRVSINLISTESGVHIFTKIFDRELTPQNLFEIQEEIASYTAANVGAPFGAVNRYNRRVNAGRQTSMSGYQALLKFYDMGLGSRGEQARALIAEFDGVLEDNPYFSSAWAAKSLLHSVFVGQVVPNTDWQHHLSEAERCAHRASVIDPDNALAFHADFMACYHRGEFEKYETAAVRALALNPNDYNLLAHYAITKALRGDSDIARLYYASACGLITTPPQWFRNAVVGADFFDGNYAAVITQTQDITGGSPVGLILMRIAALGHLGQGADAAELIDSFGLPRDSLQSAAQTVWAQWHAHPDFIRALNDGWATAI